MKVSDDRVSTGKRGFGRTENNGGWIDGEVVTPFGIVSVYAQGDDEHLFYTRLDFAHKGTLYVRKFDGKRYSPRGLVTKAYEFAKGIAEGEHGRD